MIFFLLFFVLVVVSGEGLGSESSISTRKLILLVRLCDLILKFNTFLYNGVLFILAMC